jgi:hypothetical protein
MSTRMLVTLYGCAYTRAVVNTTVMAGDVVKTGDMPDRRSGHPLQFLWSAGRGCEGEAEDLDCSEENAALAVGPHGRDG